ncbi:MAG TPA: TlyA family RNA methyltransferase [Anaerolineales bacterium]|nr:TlyA family RNA methyltransferase [Anaerolineales bacterium]
MAKQRADLLLVERGLAETRSLAQRLVMAGQVRADGQVVLKPASLLDEGVRLEIITGPKYVSRGGDKLAAALAAFPAVVPGAACADVGASTGGFTDCLLQSGARRVYAIDVGHGVLHWKLRNDPRVVVMERTNARYLERLPEPVDLVVMDAAFISASVLVPAAAGWFGEQGELIVLIKPQFEAGRADAARGQGVIRDPAMHARILLDLLPAIEGSGLALCGLIRSPVTGPKGNIEFLGYFRKQAFPGLEIEQAVRDAMEGSS